MLTVKLVNTATKAMKIVEARAVRIEDAEGVRRLILDHLDDATTGSYVLGVDDYDIAYVENARGSTVQVVR